MIKGTRLAGLGLVLARVSVAMFVMSGVAWVGGCGYSSGGVFPSDVSSVSTPIFKNETFYRGVELDLAEALIKEIELLACIMALRDGIIAPTIGYEEPDPECALDVVPNEAREAKVDVALSNAFAFGGLNAVLALKRFA